MRILQVITSLETGGAEVLVVNLVPRFRAFGHEVDVCVFDGRRTPLMDRLEKENPGVRIYKLGHGYYNPLYILKLARIMRGYDIVHTHNSSPQLFVALSRVLCSVGLCTTEHNTSNRKRGWKWYAPIESWMYGRYDHIICISKIAEEKLREYMGGAWISAGAPRYSKISTINNGIDVRALHDAECLPAEEAAREGRFVCTMVAGFRDAKDQDTLVRALVHLPERFVVWLVGIGTRQDTVRRLAQELGVASRVRFWGMRSDVPRILKSSDVVVMSSHFEGLSLSNIEGMSVGKPFVASDVNGLREVTKGWGLMFSEGDDTELAGLLMRLANDEDQYKKVAASCFERAMQFDIAQMVQGYDTVYRQIVAIRNHG